MHSLNILIEIKCPFCREVNIKGIANINPEELQMCDECNNLFMLTKHTLNYDIIRNHFKLK